MTSKNRLSIFVAAFIGGAEVYGLHAFHDGALPKGAQQWASVALGFVIAGLIAVKHLYDPSPTSTAAPTAVPTDKGTT